MQVAQEAPDLAAAAAAVSTLPFANGVVGMGPDIIPAAPNGNVESPATLAAVEEKANGSAETDERSIKRKQKRNKPTLSCLECVERKTKYV